jgi:hypothetical protein
VSTGTPERSRAEVNCDETPSPSRRCPCCGGRMIIASKARAPRVHHRPARSGSTPHNRRAPSALQGRFSSPPAAPEQRGAMRLQGRHTLLTHRARSCPAYPSDQTSSSPSSLAPRLSAFPSSAEARAQSTTFKSPWVAPDHGPMLPAVSSLRRLPNTGPRISHDHPLSGRRPKPSYEGPEVNHFVGFSELRFVRQGELPANLVSGRIL